MSEQDILDSYSATNSLRQTSAECGASIQVVRRVLATAGIYSSDLTEEINRLYNSGMSAEGIAKHLNMRIKSVINHLPYTRTSYAVGDKTKNAENIAKWRKSREEKNNV